MIASETDRNLVRVSRAANKSCLDTAFMLNVQKSYMDIIRYFLNLFCLRYYIENLLLNGSSINSHWFVVKTINVFLRSSLISCKSLKILCRVITEDVRYIFIDEQRKYKTHKTCYRYVHMHYFDTESVGIWFLPSWTQP